MWYVIQVISGQENRTVFLLEQMVLKENLEECFVPLRRLKKKFHGTWNEVTERLFPGYVFLATQRPQLLYEELKHVPALTKILGRYEEYFTPLPEKDMDTLKRIEGDILREKRCHNNRENSGKEHTVGISQVVVEEGNSIRVVSGPLRNMEGQIKKINLHKRIAEVEMEFMGSKRLVFMGIEIVTKARRKAVLRH